MEQHLLTLNEIQAVELEIMKQLHKWCEQNKIRYCMGYGTLLGAVRHQGPIPWDNDMDILMPRPDFEKMLRLTRNNKIGKNISILHHSKDDRYHYSVARACDDRTRVFATYLVEQPRRLGVWVDIFPIDGMPEKSIGIKNRLRAGFFKKLQRVDLYASNKQPIIRICKKFLKKIFSNNNNYHMKTIDYYAKQIPFEESAYVADMVEVLPISMEKADFDNPILLKYEDTEFYAPRNWKDYLVKAYGDYMQLPPPEKRVTHDIRAVWLTEER